MTVAKEQFTSVQTLCFVSIMKKADTSRDHRSCREDFYKSNYIKENEYKRSIAEKVVTVEASR